MLFNELGLAANLLRAIDELGYTEATPIQQQAIPLVLNGDDVLACAQTGTGKTAGFMLPLLQRLRELPFDKQRRRPRALILTPTRELAAQIGQSAQDYGRHMASKSAVIFGGVSIRPQIATLQRGVDIVVATPGRLLDHVQQRTVDLSDVRILVLDEGDRMLDMGFIRDIRRDPERPAETAPKPVVLGDVFDGNPPARRQSPELADRDSGVAAQYRGRTRETNRLSGG